MAEQPVWGETIRVAIDVGGTFTDLQFFDEASGNMLELKTPTTPADPAIGLLQGLVSASEINGVPLDRIVSLMHGTTIATNAVIQRRFPEAALITTAGFEDVLEIGRHMRRELYGIHSEDQLLLIPRHRRYGIAERMTSLGALERPLDQEQVRRIGRELSDAGVKIIAVCFMNSFANPEHELRTREILLEIDPRFNICLSGELFPEIREFERCSTVALNALLTPIVESYMTSLEKSLRDNDLASRVYMIQSNGGVCSPQTASREPARLLLSGPCGGTLAAQRLSATLGEPNLVAMDMGGTSFDVSIVKNGVIATVNEGEVDGCPIRLPMVEVTTLGTGGGSIAKVDGSARLTVGPESAGADPGPACYDTGGTFATVTDANVVLGRINPDNFLKGRMKLKAEKSFEIIARNVAEPLGMSVEDAALGVIEIAVSNMANATRLCLFAKGLDPADFSLVSFGGAGGLHAVQIAEALAFRRVIFPLAASTFSAHGMLWSDIGHDYAKTVMLDGSPKSLPALNAELGKLLARADAELEEDGIPAARRQVSVALDLRYHLQGYELSIPVEGTLVTADTLAAAIESFHQTHERMFSHSDRGAGIELVTVRVSGKGILGKPSPKSGPEAGPPAGDAPPAMASADGLRLVRRAQISADKPLSGPLLVEDNYSTLFIPAGWYIVSDNFDNVIASRLS